MAHRGELHRASVREQILDGARRAFAAGGYLGASVPDIAAAAGVSVGLIYRYFASKQELFLELCVSGSGEAYRALESELAAIEDPERLLRHALSAWLDAQREGNDRIVLSGWSSAERDPTIGEAMRGRSSDLAAFSERVAGMLVERGANLSMSSGKLGLGTKMLLDGILVHCAVHGDDDREQLLDAVVEFVAAAVGLAPAASVAPVDPDGLATGRRQARADRRSRTPG